MAANTNPIFTLTPNIGRQRLAAANTARDGSGTTPTAFTPGTNGSRVDSITWTSAQATAAASSAMVGRVFITDNAGANNRLIAEIAIPTLTPSTTVIGATVTYYWPGGLDLVSGQLLTICQSIFAGVQDQMDVITRGGDY